MNLLYSDYTTDYEDINREEILDILEAAQDTKPDFIIAALHWGSENISGISSSQERITDLLLQNGVDVRTLQDVLGHESLNTTQIYTHVEDTGLREAARANPIAKRKKPIGLNS